ncbi:MAG: DUF5317 domain-containing protein [Armatimonadota bacterium]
MIAEAFVLSLILGFIRKGRLNNLSTIPIRRLYFFYLSFALSLIVVAAGQLGDLKVWLPFIRITNVVQYIVLLAAIGVNLHVKDMWLPFAGTFCNFLVVTVNGGVMPVSLKALKQAGMEYLLKPGAFDWDIRHAILDSSTRMGFLSDIIPVPGYGKFMPEVASIGDVLLAVGIFIIVQRYMCRPSHEVKECKSVA